MIALRVYGDPVAQGSMIPRVTRDGRPYLTPSNGSKLDAWRGEVRAAASVKAPADPLTGPIRVRLAFTVEPSRGKRPPGGPAFEDWPDVDKLVRAVFDALTSADVWRDDKQVVDLTVTKRWTGPERVAPGVDIEVETLDA